MSFSVARKLLWAALVGLFSCRGGDARPAGAADPPGRPAGPVEEAPTAATTRVTAIFDSGQTFVTFSEAPGEPDARFRVYRSATPLTAAGLSALTPLETLPAGTGRALTDRSVDHSAKWAVRTLERWAVPTDASGAVAALPAETGLFVFTPHAEDLPSGGQPEQSVHYAVTRQSGSGAEVFLGTAGPVTERVEPLRAVRAFTTPDGLGHVYIQYMDRRRWNGTFHAPRAQNGFLGLDGTRADTRDALAFAYTYLVGEPEAKSCEGGRPGRLPAFFTLHGWAGGVYRDAPAATPYYCAIQITPTDLGETWYFGFAEGHDYRTGSPPPDGAVLVNYTEQRLLRMISDLSRDRKLGPQVDMDRVFVWGHSMGGTGALALATRYPNVFAAAYASQPMTDHEHGAPWLDDVRLKWGPPQQKLAIRSEGPEGWAAPLKKYDGTPIHAWQHHSAQVRTRLADEMAPFGISHGRRDTVLPWNTQGQPAYADLDAGRRAWGGAISDGEHTWAAFLGMPPSLDSDRSLAPFRGFKVRRNETVPGFSKSTGNGPLPPPDAPAALATYNTNLEWSATWNAWAAPPVDEPTRWCMSLRTTDGRTVSVEVTPRRTQRFRPTPGSKWKTTATGAGPPTAVTATSDGLLIVPAQVTPGGVRLCLEPG